VAQETKINSRFIGWFLRWGLPNNTWQVIQITQ